MTDHLTAKERQRLNQLNDWRYQFETLELNSDKIFRNDLAEYTSAFDAGGFELTIHQPTNSQLWRYELRVEVLKEFGDGRSRPVCRVGEKILLKQEWTSSAASARSRAKKIVETIRRYLQVEDEYVALRLKEYGPYEPPKQIVEYL